LLAELFFRGNKRRASSPATRKETCHNALRRNNPGVLSVERVSSPLPSIDRFALESARCQSPWSKWSFYPGPAKRILQCTADGAATLRFAHGVEQTWRDPLTALDWLGKQCTQPPVEGPPFKAGWLGYLSYDLGRYFENLPCSARDDLALPLFTFTFHDDVIASNGDATYQCRLTSEDLAPLRFEDSFELNTAPPASVFSRAAYESAVQRVIDYIAAGDVFQVNLAQRFTAGLSMKPRELYERMRERYPAWHGAFLNYGDHALLSNSPELFLQVTPDRGILTRPIKGTRPRTDGMKEVLYGSPKDRAELNMIIDLERNDLGRVCEVGSVEVIERRTIEEHPTVYHGAATIAGKLRDGVTFVDLLRATFPGGSVTGAPKIRAMEIIEELEPVRRGPYCGAIGYLSLEGHMQFNVAIRTMIAKGDKVHFSVGGGIVADSSPAAEYDETIVKTKAMMETLRGTDAGGSTTKTRRDEAARRNS
jgi:para-aminobenzoate synthetase component 1